MWNPHHHTTTYDGNTIDGNAIAILGNVHGDIQRGLIYLLVEQREELMRHVQKRHGAAGRQLFKGPNAIYALREMLSDILNDASLPPTYLLVDALDDCTMSLLQKMTEAVAALQKLQSIVRVSSNLMR
jgi:hypothetical protein